MSTVVSVVQRAIGDGWRTVRGRTLSPARFRLASGLLRGRLQRLIASDLDRLKDLVETEIPPS